MSDNEEAKFDRWLVTVDRQYPTILVEGKNINQLARKQGILSILLYTWNTLSVIFFIQIYENVMDLDFQTSGLLFIVLQKSYSAWNIIWNYFHLGK